ncbi:MAG: histidinol-phosphatase [Clostridia bacterium]|nr:histidinol-phosphatase [Clostridia bacterium]
MGVIDFHAHILPGADHGSHSVNTSLVQLDIAKKHGIDRIVATPHFYPHKHDIEVFLQRRALAVSRIAEHLNESSPKIAVGSEVMLCIGLERFSRLDELTIGNSNTLLIEPPPNDFSEEYISTVAVLKEQGYNLILAHADRYSAASVERFLSEGVKLQINASALCTLVKNRAVYDWIRRGQVVALGSDIHGSNKRAYRELNMAIRHLGTEYERIFKVTEGIWNSFKTI